MYFSRKQPSPCAHACAHTHRASSKAVHIVVLQLLWKMHHDVYEGYRFSADWLHYICKVVFFAMESYISDAENLSRNIIVFSLRVCVGVILAKCGPDDTNCSANYHRSRFEHFEVVCVSAIASQPCKIQTWNFTGVSLRSRFEDGCGPS